jgi:metal-responsive CopG/Arc/MetJ family transcriptional regulator
MSGTREKPAKAAQVAIYIPGPILEEIDQRRGDEKRSAWILEAIHRRLASERQPSSNER